MPATAMNRLPSSRTIVLSGLLAVGAACLYTGIQRSQPAVEPMEESSDDLAETASGTTPIPVADEQQPAPQPLELKVRPNERFPLLKTVRQVLKQPAPGGGWSRHQSVLELLLSVSVEEVRPPVKDNPKAGVIRLAVRYHRVRFTQDLPAHEVDYDSDRPPARIPLELQAYHGMKDNGFQFWLGRDNQIVETVGFDKFLERCLHNVPPQHRPRVRAVVESTSGTEGVANFVDQSIGILPADLVREGTSWSTRKKYLYPVPMWIKNQYTLKRLSPETAEIEILGSVEKIANFLNPAALGAPANGLEIPAEGSGSVAIEIKTGHTTGSYLVDRRTGLPRESRVEQTLAMTVHLAGNVEFPQEKTTLTTIGYFTPDRSEAITIGHDSRDDGHIQRAAAAENFAP